jgi:hypothetical protein
MYKVGTFVKNLNMPEWGIGEIVDQRNNNVVIIFEEVGQKILSLSHAKLQETDQSSSYTYLNPHINQENSEIFSRFWVATFDRSARNLFKKGNLVHQWSQEFPQIFDQNDLELANGPQGKNGYHFVEWFAAITIFKEFGLPSLVGKYECPSHTKKREILEKLITKDQINFISNAKAEYGNSQCPDLLVYQPDYSDFFFIEVKGPTDFLKQNQIKYFKKLKDIFQKEFQLFNLEEKTT